MGNMSRNQRLDRNISTADYPGNQHKGGLLDYNEYLVYQKNMQALSSHYPELAKLIDKTPVNRSCELIRTGSGKWPNLRAKAKNMLYYRPDNPIKDVENQLKELKLKNTRMAVFLGFGLGFEMLYFAQNMVNDQRTSYILVIEKEPEIFKMALKTSDLVPFIENSRTKFMVGLDESELYTEFRNYLSDDSKYVFIRGMKPVYHTSSINLHKDYYLNALKIFRESAIHQILNFGDDPYDSLIGIENMLSNLNVIITSPGINMLYEKFRGRPAVVVATGPSLNKNKHLLKDIDDKALIIAADASLKILLGTGIKPHLVTSLERVPETALLLDRLDPGEVKEVYLCACPVIRKECYDAYNGPRIIVYRNFDHFKWLGIDKGILDIQLSAGNMAFKVAEALGCDPIILIGQDLAFGRDGRTHASGAVFGEDQGQYREKTLEVMGNDGQPILTTETWHSFLRAYELDISGYGGKCINSTEGGAYINGTTVIPFQESIDRYIKEKFDPLDVIKSGISTFSADTAEKDISDVLELIDRTAADMREIIENCREGVRTYEKYRDVLQSCFNDPDRLKKMKGELPRIENEVMQYKRDCKKSHSTFQLFFAHVFQSFHIKFEMEMVEVPEKYENEDHAVIEIILRQAEWFAVIGDLAGICLNSLLKAKEKLPQMKADVAQ